MTLKHTPGPWHAVEREFGHAIFPETAHNPMRLESGGSSIGSIAIVGGMESRGGEGTDAANARLIALAPELLTAVRAARPLLVALFDQYTVMRDQLREGRVPKPLPAYPGEDERAVAVVRQLTALLAAVGGQS